MPEAEPADERIVNGLYIFEIEMREGKRGQATGVVVLRDGRIMGGDSYFYCTGRYTFRSGKWRGELTVNQHTQALGRNFAFGGREVTCGFSGAYAPGGADIEGMALVGKTSVTFAVRLTLKEAM